MQSEEIEPAICIYKVNNPKREKESVLERESNDGFSRTGRSMRVGLALHAEKAFKKIRVLSFSLCVSNDLFLQRFHMIDQKKPQRAPPKTTVFVFVGPFLAWMQLFCGPHIHLLIWSPHFHHHHLSHHPQFLAKTSATHIAHNHSPRVLKIKIYKSIIIILTNK